MMHQLTFLPILALLVQIPNAILANIASIPYPDSEYQSLGCWKDLIPRAIPSIEGKSSFLDGHYKSRTNAKEKCFKAALALGYRLFAIQDGGQCFSSYTANNTYTHYGTSAACSGDGEGGPLANNVYEIRYDTLDECLCNLPPEETCFKSISSKKNGQTALHFAIGHNNTLCAEILLDSGANVDAVDGNGLTPLELAVSKASCGPIKLLVEQNANMDFVYGKDRKFVNECVKAK